LDTYGAADAYFDAHERTRWMVPGQDEVVGWKPVEIASHVSGDPGMTATTTPQASAASDTLAIGDGSNAVGTGPLV
jgi:hypothetical protein